MKKTITYLLLLIGFSIGLSVLANKLTTRKVVLEKGGYQFVELSKEDVVLEMQPNYMFIIKDEIAQTTKTYKIVSQHASHKPSQIYVSESPLGSIADEDLFVSAMNKSFASHETLMLDYEDLKNLISNADNFSAKGIYIAPNKSDWLATLEETGGVFILVAGVLFILLVFYEIVILMLEKLTNKNIRPIVNFIFLGGAISFLFWGLTPPSYVENKSAALVQLLFTFIPLYFVFQFVKTKYLQNKDFADQALIRFCTMLFGAFLFVLIGKELGRAIDLYLFDSSMFTGIAARKRLPLELGFAYAFALADLIMFSIKSLINSKKSVSINIANTQIILL